MQVQTSTSDINVYEEDFNYKDAGSLAVDENEAIC
jgi:hypothetical protein